MKRDKLSIIFINIVVTVLLNLVFCPHFSNEADIVMQSMIYGTNQLGIPLSRILFSNAILGKIMVILFLIFPKVAWYTIMHYLAVFISLTIITYVTYKRNPSKTGWIIVFIIEAFLGYECYVTPTYLKTAAILCVAGWSMVIYALESKKGEFLKFATAVIILGLSSMFSFKMFLIATTINGVISIIYIILNRLYKENLKKILLALLALIAVVTLAYGIDGYAYLKDPNWREAYETRSDYEKAFSYGVADYDERFVGELNSEYASSLLIKNEAGYRWLASGRYLGKNGFTNEVFHKVVTQSEKVSFETLNMFFKKVPIQMFGVGMLYLWIILILIACFYQDNNYKKIICWSSFALLLIVLYILYIRNDLDFIWVKSAVMFSVCGGILSTIKDAECAENRVLVAYLLVFSVLLYNKFSGEMVVSINQTDMKEQYEQQLNLAYINIGNYQNGVTQFFFEDLDQYFAEFSAFKPFVAEVSLSPNVYNVNGVYMLIPGNDKSMYNYGVDDGLVYGWVVNGRMINEHDLAVFN